MVGWLVVKIVHSCGVVLASVVDFRYGWGWELALVMLVDWDDR